MHGTDIISYGVDLTDYVNQEFEKPRPGCPNGRRPQVTVTFWRDYVEQCW
ncbi:hypothetical protein OG205_38565 [Lentzea sp. NBC_00516]|nr:hypothetical protein [Lentzea sp. NBC_00516]WUD23898.1 hypothetical protein OG205_38565 [Lentzea sp. NBC_00516]